MELVETTIDLDAVVNHEFRIRADFDDHLQGFKAQLDEILAQIPLEQNRVSEELNLEIEKKLKLEKTAKDGFYFRVTKNVSDSMYSNI